MNDETQLSDLTDACRRVLDVASRLAGDVASVLGDVDQYWTLSLRDAFELVDSPDLLVGSLSDDIAELRASATLVDSEHVLWHELEHAANIMRFLAFSMLESSAS